MTEIRYTQLQNGMRVLTERMSAVETVSLGVWLSKGSRDEQAAENGMFHFIEHTLFKGTASRNARAIAEQIDGVGGILDAFTGKEETCYSIKVRENRLHFALQILADMLVNPLFDEQELARERMVILEEIKMEEDNPEDLAYELSLQNSWKNNTIGASILGTESAVRGFNRARALDFHQKHYGPGNYLVSAAGKVDHDQLCAWLEALFPVNDRAEQTTNRTFPEVYAYQKYISNPNLEQVNFCLNFPGFSLKDPKRNAFYLLNTLLGGSASSRLFQRIREEQGLAYSVGSFTNACSDCGLLTVYGGCSPENFELVMDLALDELRSVKAGNIQESEVSRAREQFTGSLVMSLETTQGRASMLARSYMYSGEIFNLGSALRQIEKVTTDEVREMAATLLTDKSMGLISIGRLGDSQPKTPWRLD